MTDSKIMTPENWQQVLKNTELYTLTGTVNKIEHLLGEENTTAKQLADTILKDISLTAQVLKVANSVAHGLLTKVKTGTLTQVIVHLGFNSLRAICISVTLMDALLKRAPHSTELLQCISKSFETAVHARNMAKKMGGCDEEDIFIAGLLQNLGEMVFWCSSVPESQEFHQLLEYSADTPEQAFKQLSGMDFRDMSKELATDWQLSDVLLETFSQNPTANSKVVSMGRRISNATRQGWDSAEFKALLTLLTKDFKLDINSAMTLMKQGAEEANALAADYSPTPEKKQDVLDLKTLDIDEAEEASKPAQKSKNKQHKPTSLIRS